jgi:hypothetical protein
MNDFNVSYLAEQTISDNTPESSCGLFLNSQGRRMAVEFCNALARRETILAVEREATLSRCRDECQATPKGKRMRAISVGIMNCRLAIANCRFKE